MSSKNNTDNPPTEDVKSERQQLAETLKERITTLFSEAQESCQKVIETLASDEEIHPSWMSELCKMPLSISEATKSIVERMSKRISVTEANKKAFLQSDAYKNVLDAMEVSEQVDYIEGEDAEGNPTKVLNPETGGLPEKVFNRLFDKFNKPFKGEGYVSLGTLELKAQVGIYQNGRSETNLSTPGSGATSSGQQTVKRLHDNKGEVADAVGYEVLWRSFQKSNHPLTAHMTEVEKTAKNFYQGKVGSGFFERMKMEGHLKEYGDNPRGFLQKWGEAQKMDDGTARFTEIV
jgi:hypothetical protein